MWTLVPEVSRTECEGVWQKLVSGEVVLLKHKLKLLDGRLMVVEASAEVFSIGQRQLISGRAWDVTAEAEEEEKQRDLLSQLTDSQNRLVEQKWKLEQSREELELINQVAQLFLSQSDARQLFTHLEELLSKAFEARAVVVLLADVMGGELSSLGVPARNQKGVVQLEEVRRLACESIFAQVAVPVGGPLTLLGTDIEVREAQAAVIRHGD